VRCWGLGYVGDIRLGNGLAGHSSCILQPPIVLRTSAVVQPVAGSREVHRDGSTLGWAVGSRTLGRRSCGGRGRLGNVRYSRCGRSGNGVRNFAFLFGGSGPELRVEFPEEAGIRGPFFRGRVGEQQVLQFVAESLVQRCLSGAGISHCNSTISR